MEGIYHMRMVCLVLYSKPNIRVLYDYEVGDTKLIPNVFGGIRGLEQIFNDALIFLVKT